MLQIFDQQMLPWANDPEPRLVLAGQMTDSTDLPPGVLLTRNKLRGPRKALKGPRDLERTYLTLAQWPRDELRETRSPLLICVLDGRIDFRAGETEVHCGAGHFLLLPPGVPHDDSIRPHYRYDPQQITAHDFCDLLWFVRWGRIIRCWTCHSQGATHGYKPGKQADFFNEDANQLLDLLFAEAGSGRADWQTLCRHYLLAFLTVLRRDLREGNILKLNPKQSLAASTHPLSDEEQADPIEQARHYIRTHLREALTIEKVARHACMSRSQFTKLFRQRTGQSFAQYLTECRLEEAGTLLRESSWSTRRVAEYVGLRSSSYFSQLFTRSMGLTPRQFRSCEQGKTPPAAGFSKKS
jgi:AraC-like DNA-binding protein